MEIDTANGVGPPIVACWLLVEASWLPEASRLLVEASWLPEASRLLVEGCWLLMEASWLLVEAGWLLVELSWLLVEACRLLVEASLLLEEARQQLVETFRWKPDGLPAGESLKGSAGGVGRSQGNPPNIKNTESHPQLVVSLSTLFHKEML